jgi:hypothetical protein
MRKSGHTLGYFCVLNNIIKYKRVTFLFLLLVRVTSEGKKKEEEERIARHKTQLEKSLYTIQGNNHKYKSSIINYYSENCVHVTCFYKEKYFYTTQLYYYIDLINIILF